MLNVKYLLKEKKEIVIKFICFLIKIIYNMFENIKKKSLLIFFVFNIYCNINIILS